MKNWENLQLLVTEKISRAIEVLDKSKLKICLVVNDQKQFIGTITDGDLRRGILKGFGINDTLDKVMNANPSYLFPEQITEKKQQQLRDQGVNVAPILTPDKKIKDIIVLQRSTQFLLERTNRVVIMAGGLGKRLGELTKDVPKPMLKVGDKPILEVIIEKLKEHGFMEIYLSVNFQSHIIEEYFGNGEKFGVNIKYLKEPERLGTAGSLSLLDLNFTEPFLVMNGDLLTNVDFDALIKFYQEKNTDALMCVREYDFQVPFGVVQTEDEVVKKIDEKPVHKFLVNAGVYMLAASVLKYIPKNTYYDMPMLFERLMQENKHVIAFPLREYWLDIGRLDDLEKAQIEVSGLFKR